MHNTNLNNIAQINDSTDRDNYLSNLPKLLNLNNLDQYDTDLFDILSKELARQEEHIELIASENYVSRGILQLQGSILTNKYAEGYPSKRYYGGCEFVDEIENLAITRAKDLFGASYVNVQPHSGSQANAAVMLALLQPGDVILGMGLNSGGHLTHGSHVSFSGKIYRAVSYEVCPATGMLDYDQILDLALKHKPKLIIAGFSAYSRIVDWLKFREIANQVNAYLLADIAHVAGLIASKLYPSPIEIADVVTTTTHKTLRGPRGGLILTGKTNDQELYKKLNAAIFPGIQGGPLMHVIAAKALAFKEASSLEFIEYSKKVMANAKHLAAKLLEHGYNIVTGGTDNHMFLLNLTQQSLSGKAANLALELANITANKNSIPGDLRPPSISSGIRIGTAAVTTRGFDLQEMTLIADWIKEILTDIENKHKISEVRQKVLELCKKFPVYS